jgi:hypothetical protein
MKDPVSKCPGGVVVLADGEPLSGVVQTAVLSVESIVVRYVSLRRVR